MIKSKQMPHTLAARERAARVCLEECFDERLRARCEFILSGKSTAALYTTTGGVFLYVQAIKDNFTLDVDIPDEENEPKASLADLLISVAQTDGAYAAELWIWCIDTFEPYIEYAECANDLCDEILWLLDEFPKEFFDCVLGKMCAEGDVVQRLIGACTRSFHRLDGFILEALRRGEYYAAKKLIRCALASHRVSAECKLDLVSECIDVCNDFDGSSFDLMLLFKAHAFPLVFECPEPAVKQNIVAWARQIDDYIAEFDTRTCDLRIYDYCKVSLTNIDAPCYYYFPGELKLEIGDRVIVPLGKSDDEVRGVVAAVGRCYALALPCAPGRIKQVIRKL